MMLLEKVKFTETQQTNLITLYARACHSKTKNPILNDPWAEKAISRIEHDFLKFKVGGSDSLTFAVRARKFDSIVTQFLAENPKATVLYLGCGLDARVYRINPSENVKWFDIDFPDVIELRHRLFPERVGYKMIGSSLADLEWMENIPGDNPAIIIAEGVSMYLTEEIIKNLLNRIVDHFPVGRIAFDAHSHRVISWMTKNEKSLTGTNATFHWGIDKPGDALKLESRIKFVKFFKTSDLPIFKTMTIKNKIHLSLLELHPAYRGLLRPLVYDFPHVNTECIIS
jgi:O-methyltransferase involved in polyketide biosynthesis